MIAEMPPLSSFSVKSGDRTVEIRLEIKSETEPIPSVKKKKPSPSCLRRNQKWLLMLLEKDKAAESTEPVKSGSTDDSTGEPLVTRASTPAIERDGPVLPNTQIKEIVIGQDPSPICSEDGEEKVDNQDITHDDNSDKDE